ncbi:MAG: hypothetical protein ACTJHV_12195, partial [Cellulosimicrobium funkei]
MPENPPRPVAPGSAPVRPAAVIAAVGVHLPERVVDVREVERALAERNPGAAPRVPMVSRLTGVRQVHVLPDDWDASDLAVAAAEKLLATQGLAPDDVDLLLFASASQDMGAPATSHIVAAQRGVRAPVREV